MLASFPTKTNRNVRIINDNYNIECRYLAHFRLYLWKGQTGTDDLTNFWTICVLKDPTKWSKLFLSPLKCDENWIQCWLFAVQNYGLCAKFNVHLVCLMWHELQFKGRSNRTAAFTTWNAAKWFNCSKRMIRLYLICFAHTFPFV